jgi:hypothetical protein
MVMLCRVDLGFIEWINMQRKRAKKDSGFRLPQQEQIAQSAILLLSW